MMNNMLQVMRILLLVVLLLLLECPCGFGADNPGQKPAFTNESGWVWHIKPFNTSIPGSSASRGLVLRLDELKGERILLTLAHSEKSTPDVVRFRPVVFNESGQRFEFSLAEGGADGGVALTAYTLDLTRVPGDQIKYVGIEKLTRVALQDVFAPAALQKLRDGKANALPFPRVGKRYDFELTTIDGKRINASDFRGKVVLLDFWAKWCAPCMAKMPKLKDTYQKLNHRGFEIIGLNHDHSLAVAKRTIAEQDLPWTNVLAPVEKEQREFWMTATGTESLPRLLLIDRDGILIAETSITELEADIDRLLSQ